jgi:hypothetical protein
VWAVSAVGKEGAMLHATTVRMDGPMSPGKKWEMAWLAVCWQWTTMVETATETVQRTVQTRGRAFVVTWWGTGVARFQVVVLLACTITCVF